MSALPVTRAEVSGTLRSTDEGRRRSLPDGSMPHPVVLGRCVTQAVACAARGGVSGGGHVMGLVDAAPTEWR